MTNRKPLLIGFGREGTFRHLTRKAIEDVPSLEILDLNRVETAQRLSTRDYEGALAVRVDDQIFLIDSDSAVFYRGFFRPSETSGGSARLKGLLAEIESFLDLAPPWSLQMNRPGSGWTNASKLMHGRALLDCGFLVPETFVSNDPAWMESTVQADGNWINKGCSSIRTVAAVVDKSEVGRANSLRRSPSLFQRRVLGDDVRLHMVGDSPIALRIQCDRVDYRYARRMGGNLSAELCTAPDPIIYQCIEYMGRSGLSFAGFDFKIDNSGKWWVLEANAMPGFEFFDDLCDHAISSAICRLLQSDWLPFVSHQTCDDGSLMIDEHRRPSVDRG